MDSLNTYPPGPAIVPESVHQASPAFKREVIKVLLAIAVFLILYIFMVFLAAILALLCIYGGVLVILAGAHLLLIAVGIAIIGLGVMVFIFLIKFMFATTEEAMPSAIEIDESSQPELYAFVRQLTVDTQTPFPRKILVSPEVNACVFYNSSFWSMFFPVKKNLQIGLGLVNSISVSEFKAVLAHEFGHFSQRSMKLGSYVYNLNRVIYNMLFQNKGYGEILQAWANIHIAFNIGATITISIVKGIQWVLQQQYKVINKQYYSLSKEMEFHADAVAASVAGSKNMINALRKIEFAAVSYELTLQHCDKLMKEKKRSENFYKNQHSVSRLIAHNNHLSFVNNQISVDNSFYEGNQSKRVHYKDQWSSHPTRMEREKKLMELNIDATSDERIAWLVFINQEELGKELTTKVYSLSGVHETLEIVNEQFFENNFTQEQEQNALPGIYKKYFNNRLPGAWDASVITQHAGNPFLLQDILTESVINLPEKIQATMDDINILDAIDKGQIETKSFDFDGVKYNRLAAPDIKKRLELELKQEQDLLATKDLDVIRFFYAKAAEKSQEKKYLSLLTEFFAVKENYENFRKNAEQMFEKLRPVYAGETLPLDTIHPLMTCLKNVDEPLLKKQLKNFLQAGVFEEAKNELTILLMNFLEKEYAYFISDHFVDEELKDLYNVCQEAIFYTEKYVLLAFKKIACVQLEYTDEKF